MKSFRLAMPRTRAGKAITGLVVVWFGIVMLGFLAQVLAMLFPVLTPYLQPFLTDF